MKIDKLPLMQQAHIRQFELAADKMDKELLIQIVIKLMVAIFALTNLIEATKGKTSEKP